MSPTLNVVHNHNPIQHRDGKPKWCGVCGLTADFEVPRSRIDDYAEPVRPIDYTFEARKAVCAYINDRRDPHDLRESLTIHDVYIVWFAKTLQHWKALVSTTRNDNVYYELTANGDRDVIYLDVYQKVAKVEVNY